MKASDCHLRCASRSFALATCTGVLGVFVSSAEPSSWCWATVSANGWSSRQTGMSPVQEVQGSRASAAALGAIGAAVSIAAARAARPSFRRFAPPRVSFISRQAEHSADNSALPQSAEATPSSSSSNPAAPAAESSVSALAKVSAETANDRSDRQDKFVEQLEGQMQTLAKSQDYSAAAAVRDQLSTSQVDEEVQVLAAHAELYAAFSARDVERVKAVWLRAPYVQCIHPYSKRCRGYEDICENWKKLFEDASKKSALAAAEIRIVVRGATATISCQEQIISRVSQKLVRSMLATHVFRRVNSRWLLVHRHVAPLLESQPRFLDEKIGPADMLLENPQLVGGGWRTRASNPSNIQLILQQQEDDYEDIEDGKEAMLNAMRQISDKVNAMPGFNQDDGMDNDESVDEEMYEEDDEDDLEVARTTVRAIRELAKQSRISPQAKLHLLADMIDHPGQSAPERAHELLLFNVEKEDEEYQDAWEDFANLLAMEAARIDAKNKMQTDPPRKTLHNKGKRHEKSDRN